MKILITCIVLFGILELINATPTCSVRGSIAFAIDGSDSILPKDFARMIGFTIKTLYAFDLGNDKIRVGALVYSTSVASNGFFNLATDRSYIEKQIKKFEQPKDGTNTHLAITKLGEILQNGDTNVGVVITDGKSKDYRKTIAEAEKLRNKGVTMVAIGIGKKVNTTELKGIAGSDSLVKMISFDDLTSVTTIAEIKTLLCQVFPTPPPPTPREGRPPSTKIPIDSLCIGCVISHGFGYNYIAGDCTKFVMCFPSVDSSGNEIVRAQIKQCGFGTYWSQEKHTCVHYKSSTCKKNICAGKSDGYTLPYLGCRSYWSCMNALPVPMCCPSGQIFSGSRGGSCAADVSNACSNVVCSSNPTVAQCTRTENKNNRATYYQKVHGRDILRNCAPGTLFSKDTCMCAVHGGTPSVEAPTCNPKIKQGRNAEVGTQGKAIHKFIGAHGQYISTGARNVDFTTSQLYAIFGAGGAHSEINFWSLANAHFDKTFAVSFSMELTRYTGGTARKEQVLDNCLCHTDVGDKVVKHPSISIQVEKRPRNVYVFTGYIETYNIPRKTLTITQTSSGGFLDVTMAYNGSNLVFKVGGTEVATQLTGQIERRNTGLIFGRPTSDDIDSHKVNFLQAKMKNIVIYDCITKSLQDDLNNM